MSTKHTLGQWEYTGLFVECEGEAIAMVIPNEKEEFYGRLMASAPQLIEVIGPLAGIPFEDFTGNAGRGDDVPLMGWNGHHITIGDVRRAREAIAKVRGEPL